MKKYLYKQIEAKWQDFWDKEQTFKTEIDLNKPKFYVLSMFPYPSGAGLHIGHPLGYVAADIVARFKKGKGYNVLHPMGFDAFGLPTEQHALQTGEHPVISTKKNIEKYILQLKKIGLSYDWGRMINTTDPEYYKWTQWLFVQIFHSWYDLSLNRARPILELIEILNCEGNEKVHASCSGNFIKISANQWKSFSYTEQQEFLLNYRLAYSAESSVNWCQKLGTVLSNDEIKDGCSERGGYPVEKRLMKQWMVRISAYAERLINDLEDLEWPEHIKLIQKNWIGGSTGYIIDFKLQNIDNEFLQIFTTRPETIFGVTYLGISPVHPLVSKLSDSIKNKAKKLNETKNTKKEGIFTGIFAVHPIRKNQIPIWISNHVLHDYGLGSIMGVPCHDERDLEFANEFSIEKLNIIKDNMLVNSDFLNGKSIKEAKNLIVEYLTKNKIGKPTKVYRLHDAVFSRQRYWGEPFPIYYENNIAKTVPNNELPVTLPNVENYKPNNDGRSPLSNLKDWRFLGKDLETDTMPSWAGSSWYFFRYMSPKNSKAFVGEQEIAYWKDVDLYIGGAEHATGHLIYARFFTKFLYDRGFIPIKEPFKKLFNQGMILGQSCFVYRIRDTNTYVSYNLKNNYDTIPTRISIDLVSNKILNIDKLKKWRNDFKEAEFILENGEYHCGIETEKMSKSKHNVITPEIIIDQYGADTLRIYAMFLGPLEASKIWDVKGIEGVYRFLIRVWNLFYRNGEEIKLSNLSPSFENLKTINTVIKKVNYAINKLSFNTAISAFMIALNELELQNCDSLEILLKYIILLSPFAPHLCEELWQSTGHKQSIHLEKQPTCNENYLFVDTYKYPISVNGKVRTYLDFKIDCDLKTITESITDNKIIKNWVNGTEIKKIVFVKGKIINIVL